MNSGYGGWTSCMVNYLSAMVKSLGFTRYNKPDSLVIFWSEARQPHASDKKPPNGSILYYANKKFYCVVFFIITSRDELQF